MTIISIKIIFSESLLEIHGRMSMCLVGPTSSRPFVKSTKLSRRNPNLRLPVVLPLVLLPLLLVADEKISWKREA